ncbi:hypothetical protein DYB38_010869 [Aphanomyces astaci]|uniref:LisH domain-containing protein n=1 Tax=Aphanomyces astaci TaxID=112090 RepID=A0A397C547_APHAT|nr:hypothetical protein DYB38_010869 [Aphanomyces astaci]
MDTATAAAFTLLLVQDHLKHHGMYDTLAAFSKELVAKAVSASPDVWYDMTHAIGIHGLLHEYPHESTLSALVHVGVIERQTRLRATTPSVVRITPKTNCRTSTVLPDNYGHLPSSASSPSLRPKSASAAVVATSTSTPTLGRSVLATPTRGQDHHHHRRSPTNNQLDGGDMRLLKYMNLKQREPRASLPQLKAIEAAKKEILLGASPSAINNIAPAPSPCCSSSSSIMETTTAPSQWISDDVRMRQVRRGLAHVQEELHVHNTYEMVLKHQGIGKTIPPRPKERAVLTCTLCLHSFQKQNLPHQVPYKAVMDLRRSWDPHMKELNPTRARPPTCYDMVRICVFCAQFVQESDRYRPADGAAATVAATDGKLASMTSALMRRSSTVYEMATNDPFSCDPIMDGDDDGDVESCTSMDNHNSVGGVFGKNIRYQMQNARTVRNLSKAEWGVISAKQHKHLSEYRGDKGPTMMPLNADDIRRSPVSMKRLLMDATKLAPSSETSYSGRPSPVSTDRRHTTDEISNSSHR